MSTTLYFQSASNTTFGWGYGRQSANLAGSSIGWQTLAALTARGPGVNSTTVTSVTGPTNGLEVIASSHWISEPLDQDVTISGTITFNMRMAESMASANAGAQCVIERLDATGAVVSTIINSEKGTEVGTAEAAENWTGTPTSTSLNKGDRLRIRVAFNDAGGTMASGLTLTFWYGGTSAGASGDSFVTFTETFGFLTTTPSGSVIYPTDVASDVATAAVDREAWTSRGAGVQNDVVNTATGWTNPIQLTDTAGGTAVDWWTKQLSAFTLGGRCVVNDRCQNGLATNNATPRWEIAVCDGDGSNCVVWGASNTKQIPSTSEVAKTIVIAGDDTSVGDGQRLRLRRYIDDGAPSGIEGAMVTGSTQTFYYAGTSGGASGDTFLTFTETLSEFVPARGRPPMFIGDGVSRSSSW